MHRTSLTTLLAITILLSSLPLRAEQIHVAVASNFSEAARTIAERFEQQSGHQITLSFGSTGKHYAQIHHGAPFDAFLAADRKRPQLLEQQGQGEAGSRFTYAIGRVVLWSPKAQLINNSGSVLQQGKFRYLAMANPKLAPYGRAAQQIMEQQGSWQQLRRQAVRGENIGQTYQYVKSGNAELGFVAYSQILQPGGKPEGSYWIPEQSLYDPIEQQAILLKPKTGARAFLTFLQGEEAQQIIHNFGYGTPAS